MKASKKFQREMLRFMETVNDEMENVLLASENARFVRNSEIIASIDGRTDQPSFFIPG
jgi:hypothetical protein